MVDFTNTILTQYVNKETGSAKVAKNMKQIGESIKIPTYLLEQFKKKTIAATTAQKRLTAATNKIREMSNKYGVSANRVTSALESQGLKIDKTGKSLRNARGQTVAWDNAMGKLRQQMRPFKAHLLSLMFAGMALQKTFGGMVRQVMEMTGIFEVWRGVLAMILLPILLPFSRTLMNVMFWLMKHKTVAKFVGWFIVFAAALGAVVMFLAMAGLALEGVAAWTAGAGLMKWFGVGAAAGKVGGIWGALSKLGMIALGIKLIKGLAEFDEDRIWGSIGEVLKTAGFLGVLMKKPRMGMAFAFIGIGLESVQNIVDKKPWDESLRTAFSGLGEALLWYGIMTANPYAALIGLGIKLVADVFWEDFTGFASEFKEKIKNLSKETINLVSGFEMMHPEVGLIKKLFGVEGYQYGGSVQRTGVYKLHAGETVTPAGGIGGFSPTINVYANIQSDMDIKRLADRLSVEMGRDFERDYGRRAT